MKKTKLYDGDVLKELFVCDGKPTKRKFRGNQYVKKYTLGQKIKSAFESVALYSVLTLAVVASVVLIAKGTDNAQASSVVVDNLSTKVEGLRWEVVDRIEACESAGHTESEGLVTFDPHATNTKVKPASFGTLQYKVDTVIHYYKKLYSKVINAKDAILIALDRKQARQLAYDIIFKSGSGTKDWVTCGNKKEVQDILLALRKLK